MQKVVDYKLIASTSPEELSKLVKKAISQDWVPSGTVVAFDGKLIQAMVQFSDI